MNSVHRSEVCRFAEGFGRSPQPVDGHESGDRSAVSGAAPPATHHAAAGGPLGASQAACVGGVAEALCPDWDGHDRLHRGSELTWWRVRSQPSALRLPLPGEVAR